MKDFLDLSDSDDARINTLLPIVDSMLQNFTRRNILQVTNTDELHNGDRTPFLTTKDGPIISVASLTIINPQGLGLVQTLVEDTDFKRYEEYVQIIGAQKEQLFDPRWGVAFSIGENNVKITYDSGFATIPPDIQMAAFITMDSLFHSRTPGVISEKIGNYQYRLANPSDTKENSGLPNDAADLIRAKIRPQLERSAQAFGEAEALRARSRFL